MRTYRLLWIIAGALGALALGYLGYRWLKRPRALKEIASKALAPVDKRALAALDALRLEDLPGKGRAREFYFRLSEILRGYLGERYGFEALECTGSELLAALRKLHTPGLPHEELTEFVQESELVKFAKAEASPDGCKLALELGYRLVKQTAPPPVVMQSHAEKPRVP